MKPSAPILILALLIWVALPLGKAADAQGVPDEDLILSKNDAAMLFSMSAAEWEQNVKMAVGTGVAQAMRVSKGGLGMVTAPPGCDLMVVAPDYGENAGRPDFIQVIIGYREPLASIMTDQRLREMIDKAQDEMKPDYDVIGGIDQLPGGKSLYFIISEARN